MRAKAEQALAKAPWNAADWDISMARKISHRISSMRVAPTLAVASHQTVAQLVQLEVAALRGRGATINAADEFDADARRRKLLEQLPTADRAIAGWQASIERILRQVLSAASGLSTATIAPPFTAPLIE